MSTWQDVVESASQGESGAIAALMEQHLPRLRAFVRLRMGPQLRAKESASDLVQSACREVLANLDRYQHRSEANFRRWLFTTALRKVRDRVDYYRADKRNVDREAAQFDPMLGSCYADFVTPSADLDMRERIERFERVFDQLPADHREVITLARIVRLSHQDVADAMGRTEAASRMLLSRALAQLATVLERQAD